MEYVIKEYYILTIYEGLLKLDVSFKFVKGKDLFKFTIYALVIHDSIFIGNIRIKIVINSNQIFSFNFFYHFFVWIILSFHLHLIRFFYFLIFYLLNHQMQVWSLHSLLLKFMYSLCLFFLRLIWLFDYRLVDLFIDLFCCLLASFIFYRHQLFHLINLSKSSRLQKILSWLCQRQVRLHQHFCNRLV